MVRLYDVIRNLSKEECRNTSLFLRRTNATFQRKDVACFDFVRKNKNNVNEDELLNKLYKNSIDKNAFYRLKNRLLSDINNSLLQLHYNKDNYYTVINHLVLSKIFATKGNYNISYNYLLEAEKKAKKNEYYDLLDLIYSDLIKLSQDSVDFNPFDYIERRKANHKTLHTLQEIDDMLAALVYRIKVSQNYSKTNQEFTELFQKTINEFVNDEEIQKSAKLQFKIYHSISRILLQQRDYESLESYLKLTYNDFLEKRLFNKSNHDSKLQMLTYLVNALFKNNKINQSLEVAEKLHLAMQEFNGLLFNKYLFYYYNSLVINYQVNDKNKAIEVLLEAKTKPEIQSLSFYTVFVYLNLAVLYFDTNDFKSAKTNLAKLKRSESFAQMDLAFQLKVNVFELMVFYEIGDIDLFDYQKTYILKDFEQLINDDDYKREKAFIDIVSSLENYNKNELKQKAGEFKKITGVKNTAEGDNDIIDYNEWLNSKIKGAK